MKYLLSGGILLLLLATGIWWWQSANQSGNYLGSKERLTTKDLTVLPTEVVPTVKPTEVVELKGGDTFDLTASIVTEEVGNRLVKRLAYNGQIPGPVIKVEKGAKVTINFTNHIDMDTALHSHGIRGDWKMDGAVPLTPPVKVGETFSYELVFPDTGVFWYHPHVREDYQQELGLYGNFVVSEDGYWSPVDQEDYLIVDDWLEGGQFNTDYVTNTLMGRYGNQLLINDQLDYQLTVKQGEISRVFITNVANTRTFDLAFPGAEMKLVGGDMGRIEREKMVKQQIIAPAERYVLELYYDQPGEYEITHRGQKMGTVKVLPTTTNRHQDFLSLRTSEADYATIRNNQTALLAASSDKNLRLDIELLGMKGKSMRPMLDHPAAGTVNLMGMEMTRDQAIEHCAMMPNMTGCEPYRGLSTTTNPAVTGIEWEDDMAMMNQASTDKTLRWVMEDTDTKDRNEQIHWSFAKGDLVKIRVYNDPTSVHPMQHPLHFHGQRFVVLATDGQANDDLQWKDTVLIPNGVTVDLLVDMSNPGQWMAHCHIAEHLHSGMMLMFEVK